MTRRSIPLPDLTDELTRRMEPVAVKRPGWGMQAAWVFTTLMTGIGMVLGILFGLVFILPVAAVFRRVRR